MQELHKQFVQLGRQRNKLTNKLLAMLPEIFHSGIYKKYATTIEEYAGKFAGLSKSAVQKRFRLEKNLENKPCLKAMIALEGINKVALLATIATPETDKFLADKVANIV